MKRMGSLFVVIFQPLLLYASEVSNPTEELRLLKAQYYKLENNFKALKTDLAKLQQIYEDKSREYDVLKINNRKLGQRNATYNQINKELANELAAFRLYFKQVAPHQAYQKASAKREKDLQAGDHHTSAFPTHIRIPKPR